MGREYNLSQMEPPRGPGDPYAGESKRTGLWVGLVAGLILLAILGVGFGLLSRNAAESEPALQAMGENPPPALSMEAEPPPPVMQVEGEPGPQMPDHIRQWLAHLERTEQERVRITQEQIGQLLTQMVALQAGAGLDVLQGLLNEDPLNPGAVDPLMNNSPAETLARDAQQLREQWRQLNDFFGQVPAPPECGPLAADYTASMRETGALIEEIVGVINSSGQDPSGAIARLQGIQGRSQAITQASQSADQRLNEIFRFYNERPWFRIATDVGGGLLPRGIF